jgi:hypothetical protein
MLKSGKGEEYIKYGMSIIKILNSILVYRNHGKYKLFFHIRRRNTKKKEVFPISIKLLPPPPRG